MLLLIDLLREGVEVLHPLPLQHGPESLDGIELTRVWWEQHLLKILIVHLLQNLGMMDLQIIEHHHRPAKALRFQLAEKAHKLLAVVAATEDFVVNQSS
jgi:hypothetical protein